MTFNKKIALLVFITISASICFGQKGTLEPARDFKEYQGSLKLYYDNLFPLLYEGFDDNPIIRYTSIPSFSKEYAFSLKDNNGDFYLVVNSLSENYWYAKKKSIVKLKTQQVKIDSEFFKNVVILFRILAEQTKIPDELRIGFDGITYYFASTNQNGSLELGETWSPNENSNLGKLVELCDLIFKFGNGKEIDEDELILKTKHLIKVFTE